MNSVTKKKERVARGAGRDLLLEAATYLFLEDGFEATSPQAIYSKSGVGQGSFYHHFSGKDALANEVLSNLAKLETKKLDTITKKYDSPLDRLNEYLMITRMGTKGCKFGRFVYESSVRKKELSKPIRKYFDDLIEFLVMNIDQAQTQSLIKCSEKPKSMAQTIISYIQGGYILSRVYDDDSFLLNNILTLRLWLGLDNPTII